MDDKYHPYLMYTHLEAFRSFPELFQNNNEYNILKLPQRKRYLGVFLGLYALEDKMDQIICKAAKQKGLELIILNQMIGSHQIVTEILDTRNRIESFSHLTFYNK